MIVLNGIPQTSMDLLRLIIIDGLGIAPERVNVYDEKWIIPPDDSLYIVLEYRSGKCIANRNTFVSTGATPTEVQDVNMLEKITIGVFSKDRSATQRKEEILMSLISSFSQGLQEKYSFKIARIAGIDDLSALEGTAMLKRYDIDVSVLAWYTKTITPGFIGSYTIQLIASDYAGNEIQQTITQKLTQPK